MVMKDAMGGVRKFNESLDAMFHMVEVARPLVRVGARRFAEITAEAFYRVEKESDDADDE